MAWAEDYRQEWIAETVQVFGFINRDHIERKFGISSAQAVRKAMGHFAKRLAQVEGENPRERKNCKPTDAQIARYHGDVDDDGSLA